MVADNKFTWETRARLVDCDYFNHVNNAAYAKVAEEARVSAPPHPVFSASCTVFSFTASRCKMIVVALVLKAISLHEGAFDKTAAPFAATPAVTCHIEYNDQVMPLESIQVGVLQAMNQSLACDPPTSTLVSLGFSLPTGRSQPLSWPL